MCVFNYFVDGWFDNHRAIPIKEFERYEDVQIYMDNMIKIHDPVEVQVWEKRGNHFIPVAGYTKQSKGD